MSNEVNILDLIKTDKIVKWLRPILSKSFLTVCAIYFGYYVGEIMIERRIIADCKYMNSFRIDYYAYSCNRKLTET